MARKPAMGKIYDRMFMIGQKIKASDVSWKAEAEKIHAERWEYLHSEMHSAGFGSRGNRGTRKALSEIPQYIENYLESSGFRYFE